jgi:hypothetical protein
VTTTVDRLFAPTLGSASLAPTSAVLLIAPGDVATTTIVTVADSPLPSDPIAHWTLLSPEQLPLVVEAET